MAAGQDYIGGCGCEHGAQDIPGQKTPSRRALLRGAAAALATPAFLATACSSGSSAAPAAHGDDAAPPGASGSSAASSTGASTASGGTQSAAPSTGASSGASGTTGAPSTGRPPVPGTRPPGPETADPALLASRYNGLKPFAPAPPPPAVKPVNTDVPLPPVIDHIPTTQNICFLTIDDGAEKDPAFLQMVRDFRIPITMFLTDAMIRDDYSYFAQLRDTGYCTIQNHTLTHPNLDQVSPAKQLAEISGQQQKLTAEYGTTPYLFRAPFGNSNAATQQACKQCGLKAILRWRASFQKQGFQWQEADKRLRPGDILLAHFRGPKALGAGWPEMHVLMTNLFRIVQDQGFTFARLEDYV